MSTLQTYWRSLSPSDKTAFVARCKARYCQMSNLANQPRRYIGPGMAWRIDTGSGGRVPAESLRPDLVWARDEAGTVIGWNRGLVAQQAA